MRTLLSANPKLTRLWRIINNIGLYFCTLPSEQGVNNYLVKVIALIITDESGILTKVGYEVNTRYGKHLGLDVDYALYMACVV